MWVFHLNKYDTCMPSTLGCLKRASDPLKLESWRDVCYHVGAGN